MQHRCDTATIPRRGDAHGAARVRLAALRRTPVLDGATKRRSRLRASGARCPVRTFRHAGAHAGIAHRSPQILAAAQPLH